MTDLGRKKMINQRGTTLIMTVILLLLLSLFSLMIFHDSESEVRMAGAQKDELQALYFAEAGIQLVNYWFHHPDNFRDEGNFFQDYPAGAPGQFFLKRSTDINGAPAFLDASGRSQFHGTQDRPDLAYDSARPNDDYFLNDPDRGVLRRLHKGGGLAGLKIYRSAMPGLVCTVEATGATSSGAKRTVVAEFMETPVPVLTGAIQIEVPMDQPLPLLVHWGDVKAFGKNNLGKNLTAIPVKDTAALPDGSPYPADHRIDGWVDFYIGEEIVNPLPKDCEDCSEPYLSAGYGNIHQRQNISPDHWDYSVYKSAARLYGTYYSTDAEGRLYLDGIRDSAHEYSAQQAFAVGNSRRFIFIDTIDGNPPASGNLATLTAEAGDLSGIAYLNANLKLISSGSGKTIQAQPPPPFSGSSVVLDGIHFNGAIYSPGSLYVEGHSMLFGGVSFGKGISGPGTLEIWYDDRLRSGYLPGYPVVSIAPGSWRELDE
jgi:hypothetical protein